MDWPRAGFAGEKLVGQLTGDDDGRRRRQIPARRGTDLGGREIASRDQFEAQGSSPCSSA